MYTGMARRSEEGDKMAKQMASYLGDELALAAYDMWVLHDPVRLTRAAFDRGEMGDVCLMALMVLAGAERRAEYDSDEGDGQWRASGAIPGINRFEVLDDGDLQGPPLPPIWSTTAGEPTTLWVDNKGAVAALMIVPRWGGAGT